MKKIVLLLTALLLMICLASCKSDTSKTPDETKNEIENETVVETDDENKKEEPIRLSAEEKAKFYKVVEFDLPDDFREALVGYMYKCAELKWVAKDDFEMKQDNGTWTVGLSYKKGTVYHGVPYTEYIVNYEYFADLIVDGEYIPQSFGWNEAPGLNCASSIVIAYQQFDPYRGAVRTWIPGDENFWLETVGDYTGKEGTLLTKNICEFNGTDKMYESYAQLQRGDIIYTLKDEKTFNLHARVVVGEPTIVKNGAGKVIPSRSYITCIEQTNAFDKSRTDGVNTTWYVDHNYTLENLYSTGYVPLTFKAYSRPLSEMEAPYIGLDTEITSALLAKGTLTGTITTNFPLVFVRAEIFDKDGKSVAAAEIADKYDVKKVTLRSSFSSIFDKLEKGKDYTFVLRAGIASGNVEFSKIDFTYNK